MRKSARYAFVADADSFSTIATWREKAHNSINQWITSKGTRTHSDPTKIKLTDQRIATLNHEAVQSQQSEVLSWTITEPLRSGNGHFKTRLRVGHNKTSIALLCDLEIGQNDNIIAPIEFEAYCPRVVREIIQSPIPWCVGRTEIPTKPYELTSEADAETLDNFITDPRRGLPVIVVSDFEGAPFSRNLIKNLNYHLIGLGVVVSITNETAWGLTTRRGKEWSCYNGAIRIYWPFLGNEVHSRHPLWTRQRLLKANPNPDEAAKHLCHQLRRKLQGISTLAIREPELIRQILREAREEDIQRRVKRAQGDQDFAQLAELYAEENDRLERENSDLEKENENLKANLALYQQNLQNEQPPSSPTNFDHSETDIAPENEVPPSTVQEAVLRAREAFQDTLLFGSDVDKGVEDLAIDAGPPDKIFEYLSGLSELSKTRHRNALSQTQVNWLMSKNFIASRESKTIRSSKNERRKRTWNAGDSQRVFEYHMKPSDATAPDRCVRIYFDWDDSLKKIIVGWIGRHP